MSVRFLSVCSGIEAASVAWSPLGWKAWAVSEIDAFPCAVLAHHYPQTPNLGDMTGFKDWPDATVDLLCGGTPCQSFSNAGLRAGLDDPRGQLMLTFGAIAARYRPRWLVWENVPGVLSSNGGRDFGAFLGLLGFLGYGFAYRVLDAQFVRVDGYGRAVPQRRQRVFVVGCLGDWRSAAAVLLERESLRGDSAPRRSAGARVAATLTRGAESSGRGGYAGRRQEDDTNIVAGTIQANMPVTIPIDMRQASRGATMTNVRAEGSSGGAPGTGIGEDGDPAPTISTSHAPAIAFNARQDPINGPINGPIDCDGSTNGVLVPMGVDCFNGSITGDIAATMGTRGSSETASGPTLLSSMRVRRLMPVECERLQGFPPIAERLIIDLCIDPHSGLVSAALQCLRWHSSVSPADGEGLTPFAPTAAVASSTSRAGRAPLAVLHVLPASGREEAVIHSRARSSSSASGANGFDWCHRAALPESSVPSLAHMLRALALSVRSGKAASPLHMLPSTAGPSGSKPAQMSGAEIEASADAASSASSAGTFTTSDLGRLHPISDSTEGTWCSSVMAAIAGCIPSETLPARFSLELTVVTPYTLIAWRGKPASECPDGPRYKALGNSWAVNCARWVGGRIAMVDSLPQPRPHP